MHDFALKHVARGLAEDAGVGVSAQNKACNRIVSK
jgi:hypothetical protein